MAYSIDGSRVLQLGRGILSEREVLGFVSYALTRRHRKREIPRKLIERLRNNGRFSFSYASRHNFEALTPLSFEIEVERVESGYRLSCAGNLADWALSRVNQAHGFGLPKTTKKRVRTHKRRTKQRPKYETKPTPVQERKPRKRHFTPAPMTLPHNETEGRVVRQFKHQETTWSRMLDAVAYVFKLQGNGLVSAKQLAAKELWRSYENSGERFAQFKRMGFTMRFNLIDGIWRGDITRLTIAATKDNKSIYYRRMRIFFGDKSNEPESKRSARRKRSIAAKWRLIYPGLRA